MNKKKRRIKAAELRALVALLTGIPSLPTCLIVTQFVSTVNIRAYK